MRAPDRTPEGITNRTAPRNAAIAVGVALLLMATTTEQARPSPAHASESTTRANLVTTSTQDLLTERARTVARPAASRATSRTVTARRRAAVNHQRRVAVVRFVRAQRGKWYQYGASGLSRYDCSGLTRRAMRQAGIRLQHSSAAQRHRGVRVSAARARVGDLVSYYGHVGILVGRWRMVDAPGTGRRILERRIYRGNGLQFRRLIG